MIFISYASITCALIYLLVNAITLLWGVYSTWESHGCKYALSEFFKELLIQCAIVIDFIISVLSIVITLSIVSSVLWGVGYMVEQLILKF